VRLHSSRYPDCGMFALKLQSDPGYIFGCISAPRSRSWYQPATIRDNSPCRSPFGGIKGTTNFDSTDLDFVNSGRRRKYHRVYDDPSKTNHFFPLVCTSYLILAPPREIQLLPRRDTRQDLSPRSCYGSDRILDFNSSYSDCPPLYSGSSWCIYVNVSRGLQLT